jgi:hypothetical protein
VDRNRALSAILVVIGIWTLLDLARGKDVPPVELGLGVFGLGLGAFWLLRGSRWDRADRIAVGIGGIAFIVLGCAAIGYVIYLFATGSDVPVAKVLLALPVSFGAFLIGYIALRRARHDIPPTDR